MRIFSFEYYCTETSSMQSRPCGSLVSRATPLSLCSTISRYFGSYPPVAPSLCTHSTIPVLHTSPTKTKASNHAAESICGVRAARVTRGPGEKVGVHPRSARRWLGVPTSRTQPAMSIECLAIYSVTTCGACPLRPAVPPSVSSGEARLLHQAPPARLGLSSLVS